MNESSHEAEVTSHLKQKLSISFLLRLMVTGTIYYQQITNKRSLRIFFAGTLLSHFPFVHVSTAITVRICTSVHGAVVIIFRKIRHLHRILQNIELWLNRILKKQQPHSFYSKKQSVHSHYNFLRWWPTILLIQNMSEYLYCWS